MARQPTLEQLLKARSTIARVVRLHGPAYLPIFERLDREVAAAEKRDGLLARVERIADEAGPIDESYLVERLIRHLKSAPLTIPEGRLVYFIRSGDRVKIGFTRRLARRVEALKRSVDAPGGLQLLATVAGVSADESRFHSRFAKHRAEGEWFRLEGELLAFLVKSARLSFAPPEESTS